MLRTRALAVALLASGCQVAPAFNVQPRFSQLGLSGSFGAGSTPTASTSTADDLGLTEENYSVFPQAEVEWVGARVSMNALSSFYEGAGTLQNSMDLGGITLGSGENVDSEFDMRMASAVMTWDMVPTDAAEFGLGVGVTYADLFATVTSQNNPTQSIVTDESAPLPVFALRAGTNWGPVLFTGSVSGLDVGIDDEAVRLTDFDLNASIRLFRGLRLRGFATIGYREVEAEAQYQESTSDVDLDMRLGGPYFGVVLNF